MKATVGLLLLLLTVYCCAAAPLDETAPGECCFHFFTERIPVKNIVSVTKTHSSCLEKAFVIHTAKGRRFCVGHSVTWAQDAFNKETSSHPE
uniref:Chemokine interleukin-8-like domain-containing protein n=1 Tax=Haplochromis burtoni TaxID=8153 RepID=A0A3Q2W8Q0_HAPBU